MNPELFVNAIQKVASDHKDPSLNDMFLKKAEDQGVVQDTKSISTTPSSASSPGMEEQNLDYGKGTTDNTTPDAGGMETGKVHETHTTPNVTGEAEGIPDISLKEALATANLKSALDQN